MFHFATSKTETLVMSHDITPARITVFIPQMFPSEFYRFSFYQTKMFWPQASSRTWENQTWYLLFASSVFYVWSQYCTKILMKTRQVIYDITKMKWDEIAPLVLMNTCSYFMILVSELRFKVFQVKNLIKKFRLFLFIKAYRLSRHEQNHRGQIHRLFWVWTFS